MILLLPERFRRKIVLRWHKTDCCWIWTGWNSGNGYGKVSWEGKAWMAHRIVYELLIGPIPAGLVLDHECRNRACCNPGHVKPVTVQVNTELGDAVLFGDDR